MAGSVAIPQFSGRRPQPFPEHVVPCLKHTAFCTEPTGVPVEVHQDHQEAASTSEVKVGPYSLKQRLPDEVARCWMNCTAFLFVLPCIWSHGVI